MEDIEGELSSGNVPGTVEDDEATAALRDAVITDTDPRGLGGAEDDTQDEDDEEDPAEMYGTPASCPEEDDVDMNEGSVRKVVPPGDCGGPDPYAAAAATAAAEAEEEEKEEDKEDVEPARASGESEDPGMVFVVEMDSFENGFRFDVENPPPLPTTLPVASVLVLGLSGLVLPGPVPETSVPVLELIEREEEDEEAVVEEEEEEENLGMKRVVITGGRQFSSYLELPLRNGWSSACCGVSLLSLRYCKHMCTNWK